MTAGGTRQEMMVDEFAVRTSKQRPGRLECTDEEYKKNTPNCTSPASAKLKLEGKFSIARGIDNRVIGQSLRHNIAVLEGKILGYYTAPEYCCPLRPCLSQALILRIPF